MPIDILGRVPFEVTARYAFHVGIFRALGLGSLHGLGWRDQSFFLSGVADVNRSDTIGLRDLHAMLAVGRSPGRGHRKLPNAIPENWVHALLANTVIMPRGVND